MLLYVDDGIFISMNDSDIDQEIAKLQKAKLEVEDQPRDIRRTL